MLTPSLPLSRSLDPPVCLARFPAARLWLKDESLEDSANLPLHCHPEFLASLDTLTVSVPPAVKVAAATANLDVFWLKDESLDDSAKLPQSRHHLPPKRRSSASY